MDAWAQVLVAVLALGGPLLGYLVKVRQTSGRIRASDASELWDEARSLRHECAERVRVLEERLKWSEGRIMELMAENYRLQREAAGDA